MQSLARSTFVWWAFFVMSTVGCGTADPELEGSVDGSALAGQECQTLTWESYGQGELRSWCTGCHSSQVTGEDRYGAPTGVDFDAYEDFLKHRSRIEAFTSGDQPRMPPVGGADAAARAQFQRWLQCESE